MTRAESASLIFDPVLFSGAAASAQTRAFNAALEKTLAAAPAAHEVPPEVSRKARAEGKGVFPPAGPLDGSRWRDIPGAPAGPGRVRVSLPQGAPRGVYLHIHGGGWTFGAPQEYDAHNQRLARAAGVAVISVCYRLAPENPWPACAEDCEAAALWLIKAGGAEYGDGPLFIGGESAGAHLAAVTLLRLRARGLGGRIAGATLNYGAFDLAMTPSMTRWGARKLILSTPTVDWFIRNLIPDDARRVDPALSPLRADLGGMPPALFNVGTEDPLLDDTLFMAGRWAAAGGQADLRLYPGGVHAYDMFNLEIARQSQAAQAGFIAGLSADQSPG